MIPFRVKKLTKTAKKPHRNCESDLWDLYADDFSIIEGSCKKSFYKGDSSYCELHPKDRVLVKTGISLELPKYCVNDSIGTCSEEQWVFNPAKDSQVLQYAVADIRSRSGLAIKHGVEVLNSPGTIDNSYRKEIGVIIHNTGHKPYTITKGDKIAQMLIRPLYPSKMEIVEHIEDTGRGGYGSTGK